MGFAAEPTGLQALLYGSNTVELIWDRSISAPYGYEIRRDGEFIGFTQGVSFLDTSASSETNTRYDVIAVTESGSIRGVSGIVAASSDDLVCF